MIIRDLIISLLLYALVTSAHPARPVNVTLPSINSPNFNISLTDEAIDSLINKVIDISERYKNDVDGTVADIQQMIKADKTLPRLTRGEVIDLLENLTRTDPEELRKKVTKTRQDYQRAIMLVMPYTPKNTDNFNMEELYTKPPITHIVGTEPGKLLTTQKSYNSKKNIEILGLEPSTTGPVVSKRPVKPAKLVKPLEVHQEVVKISEEKPRKEVNIKQVQVREEMQVSTHRPITEMRFSNHRYPDESGFGIKVIKAPTLVTKPDPIHADYWHHSQKESKPKEEVKPHRHVRPNTMQSSVYKATTSTVKLRVRSTTTTTPIPITSTSTHSPFENIDLPEDMKEVVKDINFGPLKPQKFSSQYDAAAVNFQKQDSSTENVRDLLDSIGVLPKQTTTPIPGISEVADNLSPDMRELLMNFGLIENPNYKPEDQVDSHVPEQIDINPYAYTQFKPLPDSAPTRQDMAEFLAGFGLTGNSQRSAKDLKPVALPTHLSEVPEVNLDMIPESMHGILEDIGLTQRQGKKYSDKSKPDSHVFNPENTYVSEGEIKRLNQLLETIKRLEKLNRTATREDLKDLDIDNLKELTKILKQEAVIPLDQQNFGPDPLDFDVSQEKNEVKRQQSTVTITVATPVAATETKAATTTTTEEPRNPPIAALEESFGGNAGSGAETEEATLPPPRRNGFYYLVDWNSFLEVGEEGINKVNIKFSPKAGDPSRFLKVTVP